jgi:ketosteroid isomerase-like protein
MSPTRADLVRRGLEATQRTGALVLGDVAEDFVWDMSTFAGWPEQPEYRGVDGAERFMRDWLDTWEEWRLDVEDVVDAGEDVVALLRQRATAKGSGARVEMALAAVWTFRGDLAIRMRMYASHEEALAAAGVERLAK